MAFLECLLDRMQRAVRLGHGLDGANLSAIGLHRQRQARSSGLAVDENGAAAADAVLASHMGAGEAELVTQKVTEQHPHADGPMDGFAVHGERDIDPRIAGSLRYRGLGHPFHCTIPGRARAAALATILWIKAVKARRR